MGIEGLRRVEKQIDGEETVSSIKNQTQQHNIWRIRRHREEIRRRGGQTQGIKSAAGGQQTAAECTHTHTRTCAHMHMRGLTHTSAHVHTCTGVGSHTRTSAHVHTCTHAQAWAHTRTNTYHTLYPDRLIKCVSECVCVFVHLCDCTLSLATGGVDRVTGHTFMRQREKRRQTSKESLQLC